MAMEGSAPIASDPMALFQQAFERASAPEGVDPTPAALATVDAAGRPAVRIVLLRGLDERGFVFFTNYTSRKAHESEARPFASLCFYWPWVYEQVRVEGRVTRIACDESDAYFASRPRGHQISAWASRQSERLSSREELERRVQDIERRFEGSTVPRPPFWGGYRITPDRIEFWKGEQFRLHDRLVYVLDDTGWRTEKLYP